MSTQDELNKISGRAKSTPKQDALNYLAGTTNQDSTTAANTWAGTTGLTLQDAINSKAGTTSLSKQDAMKVYNDGILFEDFQTVGQWSRQSAGGSIADETTFVRTGGHAVKITYASGTSVFYDKTINTTIAGGGKFTFWVYIPSLTDLGSIALYLSSTTNFAKFFSKTIQGTAIHEGWNCLSISPSEWSNTGVESWDNTFLRLRIRINATTGTPSVIFDSLYTNTHQRPKCLITFDDSTESSYTKGYGYMSTLGLKGTNYVIGSRIGTANYMTLANLVTINDNGWDLGNHGDVNLTTLPTQAEQETEIAGEELYLTTNGFTRANKHYAYPNGGYDTNAFAALAALGYKTARTIIDRTQANVLDEKYLLTRYAILNSTSVASATGYIDTAIARGESIILNFHQIVDATADVSTKVLTADFNAIMDYIKTKVDARLIDVVTITEWYDSL